MKKSFIVTFLVLALLLSMGMNAFFVFSPSKNDSSAQRSKLVTVDVDAVFKSHKGRLESEARINEKAAAFTKEIEELQQRSQARAKELEAQRQALLALDDGAEKVEAKAQLDGKIKNLREYRQAIAQKVQAYNKQIEQDRAAATAAILAEIYDVVERKAMALGYDQVLNSKAVDKNGVPVFLSNRDETDFTSVVIDEVNKGK